MIERMRDENVRILGDYAYERESKIQGSLSVHCTNIECADTYAHFYETINR